MADVQRNVLENLPLSSLFGTPFLAAAKSQRALALAAAKFIRQYGMDASGNIYMNTLTTYFDIPTGSVSDISGGYLQDASGGGIFYPNVTGAVVGGKLGDIHPLPTGAVGYESLVITQLLTSLDSGAGDGAGSGYRKRISNRVYLLDTGGKVVNVQGMRSITVPFISMLNIPSLCIDVVNVDFTIKISTQQTTASTNTKQNIGVEDNNVASFYDTGVTWQNTQTTAVSTSTAKSSTDDSTESTYSVSMKAKQMDPPGLTAILEFITNNKDTSTRKFLAADGNVKVDPSAMKQV